MNDQQIEELINQALREEQALPEGLSERLEQYIDALAAREEQQKKRSSFRKRTLYLIGSVAAALFIGLAIFFQIESNNQKPIMADTFNDPEEAALVAQQALAFMSTQLNKGLAPVADAGKEIDKVNEILNKQLNK